MYDTEALAACGGLEAALTSPMITVAQGIHICLDNLSVAQAVGTNTKGSSQAAFLRFRELAGNWLGTGKHLSVQWIPGHVGIEGNKLADKEAKKYAKKRPNTAIQEVQTLAHAKRRIAQQKTLYGRQNVTKEMS